MREFGKDKRLQADSHEDLLKALQTATVQLAYSPTVDEAWGRALKPGPLVNALVLAFLDLPAAEREAVAVRALHRLRQWRQEDSESVSAHEIPPVEAEKMGIGVTVQPSTARRKKKGAG